MLCKFFKASSKNRVIQILAIGKRVNGGITVLILEAWMLQELLHLMNWFQERLKIASGTISDATTSIRDLSIGKSNEIFILNR